MPNYFLRLPFAPGREDGGGASADGDGRASKFSRARRCCSARSCRCSSSILSHAAFFRSAREPDEVDEALVDGAALVLRFLDGIAEVDGCGVSSVAGFLFGIAPDERRTSEGSAPELDDALDVDAMAGAGDGAGITATGVTTAPACLRTKSSLWWRVRDIPLSAARLTIALSKPYA